MYLHYTSIMNKNKMYKRRQDGKSYIEIGVRTNILKLLAKFKLVNMSNWSYKENEDDTKG